MNYHAHIYWADSEQRQTAMSIRTHLHDNGCALGRIWDKPIGPHPLPMYQAMYDNSNKECIEKYLTSQSNISILLHEDIGVDHVRDHTEGARWIGKPLELDLDFLRRIE
jgi:DOPA 4,5-dioxygenase